MIDIVRIELRKEDGRPHAQRLCEYDKRLAYWARRTALFSFSCGTGKTC